MGKSKRKNIIGLIPAAGYATRISPIPCSKEIYPIGFANSGEGDNHPQVVSSYLLANMKTAGVDKACMIIRKGKWDIPEYFGNGDIINLKLSYLVINPTAGVPFTIDEAYPFIKEQTVVFGFPDIMIEPEDASLLLLQELQTTNADVVLGLFKANDPSKVDMVKLDPEGRVEDIVIKPQHTNLKLTWMHAVWAPAFTDFIHAFVKERDGDDRKELFIGDVIREAASGGLNVHTVSFPKGRYLDIGTAENLRKAIKLASKNQRL